MQFFWYTHIVSLQYYKYAVHLWNDASAISCSVFTAYKLKMAAFEKKNPPPKQNAAILAIFLACGSLLNEKYPEKKWCMGGELLALSLACIRPAEMVS